MKMLTEPMPTFGKVEFVFGKPTIILLKEVLKELEGISRGAGRRARQARAALKNARRMKTVSSEEEGSCDDKILRYAVRNRAAVATLDRELRFRLRREGIPVVTCRNGEVYVEGSV